MSKNEDWMVTAFWKRVGGQLIREYKMVKKDAHSGERKADGVIIRGEQ
jgi:hypothetical protein